MEESDENIKKDSEYKHASGENINTVSENIIICSEIVTHYREFIADNYENNFVNYKMNDTLSENINQGSENNFVCNGKNTQSAHYSIEKKQFARYSKQ